MNHTHLFLRLFKESFLFAMEALRVNKLRTLLSLLGITIGIFAIISVFTVTDALERKIRTDVESLGNNVVYIQKWPWTPEGDGEYPWWKYMNRPLPSVREMAELDNKTEYDGAIAYVAEFGDITIKYKSNSVENAHAVCITHDYDKIRTLNFASGRYFSENESNAGKPVALLGAEINSALFPNDDALDKYVIVQGYKINVIGVLSREGSSMVNNSTDNQILLPLNFARSVVNVKSENADPTLMVKAKDGISTAALKEDISGAMRGIRRLKPGESPDFALNETSLLTNSLDQLFSTLGMTGWIIGGFSILVGGFGIANIMFVSVRERTHIIGIQKSLGSKNYFILFQFLFEAVILCIIGGLIGLALVFFLSIVASNATGFDLVLTAGNIVKGLMISATIGIISGYVPAHQAAMMNPVDAIRTT